MDYTGEILAECSGLPEKRSPSRNKNRKDVCNREDVIAWLQERRDNCIRIADVKPTKEVEGWLDDAQYFDAAIMLIAHEPVRKLDPYLQDLQREANLLIKKYNRAELQEILLIVAQEIQP